MRLGWNTSPDVALGRPSGELIAAAALAEAHRLATFSIGQFPGIDVLTVLGAAARETTSIELCSAVTTTWRQHPLTLASQALTVSDLSGGRFTLGLGASHKAHVEESMHIAFDHPVERMREYLSVLMPALSDRAVDYQGVHYSGTSRLAVRGQAPSVLLAALGPKMLKLAGEMADGVLLFLVGYRTIAEVIVPAVREAAEAAGRPSPRIMAVVPTTVTDQPSDGRDRLDYLMGEYMALPSYARVLRHEGAEAISDIALIGNEEQVTEGIGRFAEAGVTDLHASVARVKSGPDMRTMELLASLVG